VTKKKKKKQRTHSNQKKTPRHDPSLSPCPAPTTGQKLYACGRTPKEPFIEPKNISGRNHNTKKNKNKQHQKLNLH